MSAHPAALRKTFTLREFARLAEAAAGNLTADSPAARLREIVGSAHLYRAPMQAGTDDIIDPFGHGTEVYEIAYDLIRDSVMSVARVIGTD